ncbi:hypothetical protein [Xanthomonas campestris]|uniref:hypothetical protein n=1 Tax=Xanthomonas campestris TaxID=339 RepID=UPI001E5BF0AA|nr:hypothetical protein [Xanthomonas campestris]MCC5084142.1 hypothetical protein [Xanthomonas campestris]
MNIDFEAQLLKTLGCSVTPDNLTDVKVADDNGWVVASPKWKHVRECDSRLDISTWLYSWGASNYPQYLAMLRFREILAAADEETIEGLRSWFAGSRVHGPAEAVVDEVVGLSRTDVTLRLEEWRCLGFDILMPHVETGWLSLGCQMGMEFNAFIPKHRLDSDRPESLISALWREFRDGLQGLGRSIARLARQH